MNWPEIGEMQITLSLALRLAAHDGLELTAIDWSVAVSESPRDTDKGLGHPFAAAA
jgi:hypothetical protein